MVAERSSPALAWPGRSGWPLDSLPKSLFSSPPTNTCSFLADRCPFRRLQAPSSARRGRRHLRLEFVDPAPVHSAEPAPSELRRGRRGRRRRPGAARAGQRHPVRRRTRTGRPAGSRRVQSGKELLRPKNGKELAGADLAGHFHRRQQQQQRRRRRRQVHFIVCCASGLSGRLISFPTHPAIVVRNCLAREPAPIAFEMSTRETALDRTTPAFSRLPTSPLESLAWLCSARSATWRPARSPPATCLVGALGRTISV